MRVRARERAAMKLAIGRAQIDPGQRQLQRLDSRSGTRRNCRRILRVEPVLVLASIIIAQRS